MDVFNVAKNTRELKSAIINEFNEKAILRELPHKMIEDYLGFFDGSACDRAVDLMKKDILKYKELKEERKE